MTAARTLGINGLGRIGKLNLWYQLDRDDFDAFVVNVGRDIGMSLEAAAQYIDKDSTYGPLHRYLGGHRARRDIAIVDEAGGLMRVHGKEVRVLRKARDPRDIPWREHGVGVVVDATGRFVDPVAAADSPGGSLRGHLEAGARVVVQSSPFKSKQKDVGTPPDAATLIYGINHHTFEPGRHRLLSAASCTTTALAHMMRPLMDRNLTRNMLTAGMSTVHAATNSQPLLDAVPKAGAKDLRRNRSALDNIIITSTNAARALEQVMPEIRRIGFMADSVRIPTSTVSLVILNVTFQTEMTADGRPSIDREAINAIYREAAEGEARGLVRYSEEQNVSADLVGDDAAVVIEAAETHARTGFIEVAVPAEAIPVAPASGMSAMPAAGGAFGKMVHIPVTHVKIFGWYDNELGSYSQRLGELTGYVARSL
ncbi:MAG: glyceraldehyde-3-phosphate dehydrogenase [Thermoleophilia bacterium]|nr:glyceraldehyde-3-phosphate dehydrogenase [Thermoleophilia bacterium]